MTDRTELRRRLDALPGFALRHLHGGPGGESFIALSDEGGMPLSESGFDAVLLFAEIAALEVPRLLDQLDAAESALARVRELHERWPIHGDGDHPEDCDCGDPRMTVCRLCCTDGKDQHETCAAYHDHGPDKPICPTIAAIGGEQS